MSLPPVQLPSSVYFQPLFGAHPSSHTKGRIASQYARRYPNTMTTNRKSKTQCKIISLYFLMENSAALERMHTILSKKSRTKHKRGQQQTLDKQQQNSLLLQQQVTYCILLTNNLPQQVFKHIHEYFCLVLI